MQGRSSTAATGRRELDLIDIKRNPYLVDYEEQRRRRQRQQSIQGRGNTSGCREWRAVEGIDGKSRRPANDRNRRDRERYRQIGVTGERRTAGKTAAWEPDIIPVNRIQSIARPGNRSGYREQSAEEKRRKISSAKKTSGGSVRETGPAGGRRQSAVPVRSLQYASAGRKRQNAAPARNHSNAPAAGRRKNTAAVKRQRRKQRLRRRLMVAGWVLCTLMIGCLILLKQGNVSMAEQADTAQFTLPIGETFSLFSRDVQGIPEAEFEKHPAWTEDFLTPNEYSRPGETLSAVNDIFVHYTANAGTSAAQNRSYFEQQKDMHEASVSAHFIIGYNGEIIQCVPLDEIAYAVQTRNYDSISIECCYKASDGSFTQETYDSLISLLAWLTDVYDLDTNHILRHYDCGGKKCPLYYTEHADAWEQLKNDVAEF